MSGVSKFTWEYRVCEMPNGEVGIFEVHWYRQAGEKLFVSSVVVTPVYLVSTTKKDLADDLMMISRALKKPTLDYKKASAGKCFKNDKGDDCAS